MVIADISLYHPYRNAGMLGQPPSPVEDPSPRQRHAKQLGWWFVKFLIVAAAWFIVYWILGTAFGEPLVYYKEHYSPSMSRTYVIQRFDVEGRLLETRELPPGDHWDLVMREPGVVEQTSFDSDLNVLYFERKEVTDDGMKRILVRRNGEVEEEKSDLKPETTCYWWHLIVYVGLILLTIALFRRDLRLLLRFLGHRRAFWRMVAVVLLLLLFEVAVLIGSGLYLSYDYIRSSEEKPPSFHSKVRSYVNSRIEKEMKAREPDALKEVHRLMNAPIKMAIIISLLAPVLEELLFRGVIFLMLLRLVGKWGALGLSSALFSLMHFISTPFGIIHFAWLLFAGLLFGYTLIRTRRLLASILFHAMWNGSVTGVVLIIFWRLRDMLPV